MALRVLQRFYVSLMTKHRLPETERLFLIKRLAQLLRASIPLSESISLLKEHSSKKAQAILSLITDDIHQGLSLAHAFRRFPRNFSPFEIQVVHIGESSGTLALSLTYLAEELTKQRTLRRSVLGSLLYPALITSTTFLITGFLMVYLFPRILPVFVSLHIQLPLTTRIMIAVSTFLLTWGWLVLLLIALGSVGLIAWYRFDAGFRYRFAIVVLYVPLIGTLLRDYHLATSVRMLGILLSHGVPLLEALPLTTNASSHLVYRRAYGELLEHILAGERIAPSLTLTPHLFPPLVVQLIEVGERSGTLAETLLYTASLYESDIQETTRTLSTLIEPALMTVMGLLVGFIAVSIITPIYGITQHLHG